ncbi:hypothetical protein OC846_004827 [Tilletia horrida]|uniref:Ubiquitin-like domain-containing protein n=1 Tax=Tilletia horrida TaxID=155126 RepID=A0AAN6JQG7_9BASI|nr:hypothetical protein OC845_004955 [Tilletia horrida]KAK0547521.1 hypothetical protein OC846_004827 [Tilletia horrida]KAK0562987.1 hypothetical protein OC861_005032 [Tilletia horrida]
MASLSSKRPRPRPRAFKAPSPAPASDTVTQSGLKLEPEVASLLSPFKEQSPFPSSLVKSELIEVKNEVKEEHADDMLHLHAAAGSMTGQATAAQASHPLSQSTTHASPQLLDDDDADFFTRSHRRTTPQALGPSLGGKGKGRAFSALDFLPEELRAHSLNDATSRTGSESSDDNDTSDSDGSDINDSPRNKRRKISDQQQQGLPDWTKATANKGRTRHNSSSASPQAIVIDSSDEDANPVPKKERAGRTKSDQRSKSERDRLSLTPPPDEKLYNRKEWSSYIKQAVHGTEEPQYIQDDDFSIVDQLQNKSSDANDSQTVEFAPELARLFGSNNANKSRGSNGSHVENGRNNAESSRNAEAGPSRQRNAPSQTNPITIGDDSDEEQPVRSHPRQDAQANDSSDDDVIYVTRPPQAKKQTSSGPQISPFRRPPRRNVLDRSSSSDVLVESADGPTPSSSQPEIVGESSAASRALADESLDLRPQTPVVEKVSIIVVAQEGNFRLKLRLPRTKPISAIVDQVAVRATKKNIMGKGASVKLRFDGEILDPSQTLEDLDLEDQDQIEATW